MRARWWVVSALAVVAIGGVLAWRRKPAPVPPARNANAQIANAVPNQVTVQGRIRPQHVVGVSVGVPGLIEAFLVEPGQDVFEGQVLARIGAQGLESNREGAANALERAQEQVNRTETAVNSARMELSRAEADAQRSRLALERVQKVFERQRTLFREGATPRLSFEKAQTDYDAAQKDYAIMSTAVTTGRERVEATQRDAANARKGVEDRRGALEDAQQNVAASEIHSPVDGYVVAREGELGTNAEALGERLFTIATDLYALEVVLEPKPDVLKRIIPGMPATVLVLDLESAAFEGKVKEVKEKESQVIVEFGSANPGVKPGMVADVQFRFQ
jgi:multidrug resistance efflux pump